MISVPPNLERSKKRVKVFVYGSLRKGMWNNHFLDDAKLVQEGVSLQGFKLVVCKRLPAVKLSENDSVLGELYEVNQQQLERLDRLEGVIYANYIKTPIKIQGIDE